MPRILLIEDDLAVREGLAFALRRRGHQVETAACARAGIDAIGTFRPDLLLVDLMRPNMEAIQVCRDVRKTSPVPVILLTYQKDDFDVVAALEAGADDYVVKPVHAAVIAARIHAVLRRCAMTEQQTRTEFHGELVIDRSGLTVSKSGQPLPLAPSELKLLLCLSASPGRVFSRQQLLEQAWAQSYLPNSRMIDACVGRLRNKIENAPGSPHYIQTVRGFGYRFGAAKDDA